MPLDNTTVSFAVLKWISNETYRAFQQSRARDCGNIMFGVKDKLNEIGLTLAQALTMYEQYNPTESIDHTAEVKTESMVKHEESGSASNLESQETQRTPAQYTNMNEPVPDPNTWWVVPWANKMERLIKTGNELPPKDIGHLTRMQTERTSCVRNDKELVWMRDIAHRLQQPIIPEYWLWWDSLTPERQEAANNRQR